MTTTDALQALIDAGPNPAYHVKSVVLTRYQDILKARQLMRRWADISVALGFTERQWRQVAATFRRVDTGVRAGKLSPPAARQGVVRKPVESAGSESEPKKSTIKYV